MSIYDQARETAVSRTDWDEKTEVTLWQGTSHGQAARLYLKRDKGFLGVNLSLGGAVYVEQFTVALLTDEGWQLLAWANKANYDAWVDRAKAWVLGEQEKRQAEAKKESDLKAARQDAIETVVTAELYKALSAAYGYDVDEAQLWEYGEVDLRSFHCFRGELPTEAHLTITLPEHAPISGNFGIRWTNDDVFESIELPDHYAWVVDGYQPRWGEPDHTRLGEAIARARNYYAAQKDAELRREAKEAIEEQAYTERKAKEAAEWEQQHKWVQDVMADDVIACVVRLVAAIMKDRERYQGAIDSCGGGEWLTKN